jgi:hypothetical protein
MPEPLVVTARVDGQISLPSGPLALDALLMSAVATRDGLPPPPPFLPIEIPIAIEPGGRFHLASFSVGKLTDYDLRHTNQRAPVEQYQTLGPQTGRVQITAGRDKSYRIPREVGHVEGGSLTWYCLGECGPIAALVQWIPYLGKKRSVGLGRVAEWRVEPCEPWGDGFPVVRDGMPLRTLPLDWPGLAHDAPTGYRVLGCIDGPYWQHEREELSACPL